MIPKSVVGCYPFVPISMPSMLCWMGAIISVWLRGMYSQTLSPKVTWNKPFGSGFSPRRVESGNPHNFWWTPKAQAEAEKTGEEVGVWVWECKCANGFLALSPILHKVLLWFLEFNPRRCINGFPRRFTDWLVVIDQLSFWSSGPLILISFLAIVAWYWF